MLLNFYTTMFLPWYVQYKLNIMSNAKSNLYSIIHHILFEITFHYTSTVGCIKSLYEANKTSTISLLYQRLVYQPRVSLSNATARDALVNSLTLFPHVLSCLFSHVSPISIFSYVRSYIESQFSHSALRLIGLGSKFKQAHYRKHKNQMLAPANLT